MLEELEQARAERDQAQRDLRLLRAELDAARTSAQVWRKWAVTGPAHRERRGD